MFRKHLRIRRFVLGLAFAAFAVPVAPAAAASLSIFVDGKAAPVSFQSTASAQPSYLRYHEVGGPVATGPVARSERSYTSGAQLTPETKRFLAFAQATRVVSGSEITSEHSVATITPLQADGLRWSAMAKFYAQNQPTVVVSERSNGVKGPDPSLVPQLVSVSATSSGFDWEDAGIGASTAFGIALLLVTGVALARRRDQGRLTSA